MEDDRTDELESRLDALESTANDLESRRDYLSERRDKLSGEIDDLEVESEVLDKVAELFKFLIDRLVYEYAASFSEVTTEGLGAIFTDQDLSFDVDVDQKWGRVSLDFITRDGTVEGDALESFGGGVTSVESLLLRILVVLKSGLARYLFLDESLASLADVYVPQCGEFLRGLCEDLDVNVLLITHNRKFLEWSDHAYEARRGENGLVAEKIR